MASKRRRPAGADDAPDATAPPARGKHAPAEPAPQGLSEEEIRDTVRDLTMQVLRTGRVDPEGVKAVTRAMTAGTHAGGEAAPPPDEAFAEAIRRLDAALVRSAESAHEMLLALAAKGDAHTDDDLKEALARLEQLQRDYVAAASRLAEAASGNLQRELGELAAHVQRVGTDAGVEAAKLFNELTRRMASTSREGALAGLDTTREYGMRMAFFTSGILSGIAEALKEQSTPKRSD